MLFLVNPQGSSKTNSYWFWCLQIDLFYDKKVVAYHKFYVKLSNTIYFVYIIKMGGLQFTKFTLAACHFEFKMGNFQNVWYRVQKLITRRNKVKSLYSL